LEREEERVVGQGERGKMNNISHLDAVHSNDCRINGKKVFWNFWEFGQTKEWGYVSIEDKLAITARIPSPSFIAKKKRGLFIAQKSCF
jgi:hypothetical protein